MQSFIHRILLGIAIVGATCLVVTSRSPVAAQSSVIEVTCTNEAGAPLNKVELTIRGLQTRSVEQKKTNKNGTAEFKKLAADIYMVWGRLEGYSPSLHEFVRLASDAQATVELVFQSGESERLMYFENPQLASQANELLMEGFQALQAGTLDEAENKLKASLEIQESSPDAHQNLGLIYLQNQKWAEAEKALARAIELFEIYLLVNDPSMAEPLKLRRDNAKTALETIPLQQVASRADAAMKEKDYEKAISIFDELIAMAPDNPNVHYNRAIALGQAERIAEAKASVEKALELKSDDSAFKTLLDQLIRIEESGRSLRAQTAIEEIEKHLAAKEYAPALEKSKEALDSMSEDYRGTFHRLSARAHTGLEQHDEAIESYRAAIEHEPKPEIRKILAEYLFDQKRYEEGMKAYGELFEASTQPADEGFYELGKSFSQRGDQETAAMLYQKALASNSEFPAAHYDLGMYFYYQKQDKAKAKSLLERFIQLGGEDSKVDNAKAVLVVISRSK